MPSELQANGLEQCNEWSCRLLWMPNHHRTVRGTTPICGGVFCHRSNQSPSAELGQGFHWSFVAPRLLRPLEVRSWGQTGSARSSVCSIDTDQRGPPSGRRAADKRARLGTRFGQLDFLPSSTCSWSIISDRLSEYMSELLASLNTRFEAKAGVRMTMLASNNDDCCDYNRQYSFFNGISMIFDSSVFYATLYSPPLKATSIPRLFGHMEWSAPNPIGPLDERSGSMRPVVEWMERGSVHGADPHQFGSVGIRAPRLCCTVDHRVPPNQLAIHAGNSELSSVPMSLVSYSLLLLLLWQHVLYTLGYLQFGIIDSSARNNGLGVLDEFLVSIVRLASCTCLGLLYRRELLLGLYSVNVLPTPF